MARRVLAVARDGWLIFGLALLLFAAAEIGYRAQRAVRDALAGPAGNELPEGHPYASEAWYGEWARPQGQLEGPRPGFDVVYDPYRGWPTGSQHEGAGSFLREKSRYYSDTWTS